MNSPESAICLACGRTGISEGHRCFGQPRQSDLGDEWLFDVISRLKSVELTKQQALELIAAATASARR